MNNNGQYPESTTGTEFQQSSLPRTASGMAEWTGLQSGVVTSVPYSYFTTELTQDQKLRVRALELALSSLSYASSDALDRATVVHAIARKYYKFLTGDGE